MDGKIMKKFEIYNVEFGEIISEHDTKEEAKEALKDMFFVDDYAIGISYQWLMGDGWEVK